MSDVLPVAVTAEMDERYQGLDARRLTKLEEILTTILTKDYNNPELIAANAAKDEADRDRGFPTAQRAAENLDSAAAEIRIVRQLLRLVAPPEAAPTVSVSGRSRADILAELGLS